jgi:hypothetical protein
MNYKQVNIRVTPEDKKVIDKLSDKLGRSMGDAIMDAVMRRYVEVTFQPLVTETYTLYGELRLATQGIELMGVDDCEEVLEDVVRQSRNRDLPQLEKRALKLLENIENRLV